MRPPNWTEEEVLLALDLYLTHGALDDSDHRVIALSDALKRMAIHAEEERSFDTFRSPNSVSLKLQNIRSLDPTYEGDGLRNASTTDRKVVEEYFGQPLLVHDLAGAIRRRAVPATNPSNDADKLSAATNNALIRTRPNGGGSTQDGEMTTKSIEIVPDPSLMEDIAASSLTLADAVVELIANSIDAKVEGEDLEIDVLVSNDEVQVVDNACGMNSDVLAQAVRLGVKMDAVTGNTGKRKGMYGLGLKTAAGSIGRVWSVVTRPIDEHIEYSVSFDLAKWKKAAGTADFDWRVDLTESAPNADGPLGDRPHGTAIVMTKLRSDNPMAGPVLDKIGHAYRPHLDAGHVIRVNGEETPQRQYEYFEDSRHEILVDLGGGKVIEGWVALDKKTHNDGVYGMNIYRHGQLIEAWNKDWFRAHLMTSRVIGEVNADFLPVNFNKQGVERNTEEWKQVSASMREVLKPVVKASQEMNRNKSDETRFTRAIDGITQAMGAAGRMGDVGEQQQDGGAPPADTPKGDGDGIDVGTDFLTVAGKRLQLSFEIAEWQSDITPWSYIFDEDSMELQAVVNSNSKLFEMVKRDQNVIGALALADCVAEFLMTEQSVSRHRALEVRNRWLYLCAGGE